MLFISCLLRSSRVDEENANENDDSDCDDGRIGGGVITTTTMRNNSNSSNRRDGGSNKNTNTNANSASRLALDGLARNIISRRMRQMYSHLNSGVRVRIVACFDLFTAIIERDFDDEGALARECFRQFDWTLGVLQKVATPRIDNNNNASSRAKKRDKAPPVITNDDDVNDDADDDDDDNNKKEDNTTITPQVVVVSSFRKERERVNQAANASRKNVEKASNRFAFAQFYLAFLESNDESVVRSAATNRNVMYLLVRNISKDDSTTQRRFLSILQQSVLNINGAPPLKVKLLIITDVLLEQLATMSALNDGNVVDDGKDDKKKQKAASVSLASDDIVAKTSIALLKEICENPRHGACPSSTSSGELISRLLMKLRPAECDAHFMILLDSCKTHPRLAAPYIAQFSSDLQPKNTDKWLSTIRILGELIETSAMNFTTTTTTLGFDDYGHSNDDDRDEDGIMDSSARRWASGALPPTLTKSVFMKSLAHKSIVVRQASLQFLTKCLTATKVRLDLAEKIILRNQIKRRKRNSENKIKHCQAIVRKREILQRARGIASADVFPEISVFMQIISKGGDDGIIADMEIDNQDDTNDENENEEDEEDEDEVAEFRQFSKLLALNALEARIALSPLDSVNFVDVSKLLPSSAEVMFGNARESFAALRVARSSCTMSLASSVSKNTIVAVLKCVAFASSTKKNNENNDGMDFLREEATNVAVKFVAFSDALEEIARANDGGVSKNRQSSLFDEAFVWISSLKGCISDSDSGIISTLIDFFADAIVATSKRMNREVVIDEEETVRPTRFAPEEYDYTSGASAVSPLALTVFENAQKVFKSVKKSKEEKEVIRKFSVSLILPNLVRSNDIWTHAVALKRISIENLASSKFEKKLVKMMDSILCAEKQKFTSTLAITTEELTDKFVYDARCKARIVSLLLRNYEHDEAKDFAKFLKEAISLIDVVRTENGFGECCSLLNAVSFSVSNALSQKNSFDAESQSKIANLCARAVEDIENKIGKSISESRNYLTDAFMKQSNNNSLAIFINFASEETQIDAIVKSAANNLILTASVADISLSSQNVSFDGKSKILSILLDVVLNEGIDSKLLAPVLRVLARAFSLQSSKRDVDIGAPYSSRVLEAMKTILKKKRKSVMIEEEILFVSALAKSNAAVCTAQFLRCCNFEEDGLVFSDVLSTVLRKCIEDEAIWDIIKAEETNGAQFLNDIASVILNVSDPHVNGDIFCSARALQIKSSNGGSDEKQKKNFEKKLSEVLTDDFFDKMFDFSKTDEKACVENVLNVFSLCFDANCPTAHRIRCVGFVLRNLTLLVGSSSSKEKSLEKLLANKLNEELALRVSDDKNVFATIAKEESIADKQDEEIKIELINAARMFVFSSFKKRYKNARRANACAKLIASLTPYTFSKNMKNNNNNNNIIDAFEAFATSSFECVSENEKFEDIILSRAEDEEKTELLDSLPQNPSSMHFVREFVDERCEQFVQRREEYSDSSALKRALAKVLRASVELKHRLHVDTQQPDAWATEKSVVILPILLKGYSATLSELDSHLMRSIIILDSLSGQEVIKKSGFVFGTAAEKFFEGDRWCELIFNDIEDTQNDDGGEENAALKERISNAVGASFLDCRRCALTATAFPQRKKMFFWEEKEKDVKENNLKDDVITLAYDPSWLLLFTLKNLETETLSPRECVRSGILSVVISALSSTDIKFRQTARLILATMDKIVTRTVTGETEDGKAVDLTNVMLARASFRERTQVLSVLQWIRNSNDVWNNDMFSDVSKDCKHPDDVVWPTTATSFAAEAMWLACRPESEFFTVANKQVLKRMSIDLDRLPMFLPLINSGDADAKAKRTWALRQLNSSFHDLNDKENLSSRVLRKHFVFEILTSQTCSHSLADSNARLRTMRLIGNICENGSDSLSLELIEHVSFLTFLTRRVEESLVPRMSVSSSSPQDLSIDHRTQAANLALLILFDLAKAPDAFIFAGRDFVDACRCTGHAIISRLLSGRENENTSASDYLVAKSCLCAYLKFHAVVSKRTEKRQKLNSQLVTILEMQRLLVEVNESQTVGNKEVFAEILETSSFDFSCLEEEEEEGNDEERVNESAQQLASFSIASAVSHLAMWLNENFSRDKPKVASRFLCRTLLNAPKILLSALFKNKSDDNLQTFAKIVASDCDCNRRTEVISALLVLFDFHEDKSKRGDEIEKLKSSESPCAAYLEALLREIFFSNPKHYVVLKVGELVTTSKNITTAATAATTTPIKPPTTQKKKRRKSRTPGTGAAAKRAEKRAKLT